MSQQDGPDVHQLIIYGALAAVVVLSVFLGFGLFIDLGAMEAR